MTQHIDDNQITGDQIADDIVLSGTGSIRMPDGTTAQRPGSAAAGMFRYNTTLSKFEGYTDSWGEIGGGGTNTFTRDTFTGDGSDTTFTLAQSISDENNLIVFIDGVFQNQSAYSVSGTTLTFGTAPASSRTIIVYSVKAAVSGSNLNIDNFSGDGSDTTFTLSITPVSENNTQVYIDGVYQHKNTYATSGTTLTFSTAPPNGTAIEVMTHTQTNVNQPTTGSVVTASIADNAITSAKIAAGVVIAADIANDSIDSQHYADGSIDTAHIAASQITNALMADDAIDSAEIADGAVDTVHIADLNVTTAKIAADAVTGAKIADDAIDSEHYAAGSIDTAHIADLNVTTAKIAADAITGAKIADDAIDSEHYAAGSIDTAHIAADQITSALIADDQINSEHYVDGSIDTAHIADDQVTGAKIENAVTIATSATSPLMVATTSARITQVAITSSSNATAWDAAAAANAYYATSENTTFSAPSNATEGAIISVEIAQGGTARTVAWNTIFEFAASTAPTITATANKTDILTFRYNGSVWQEIGRVQNMAQT